MPAATAPAGDFITSAGAGASGASGMAVALPAVNNTAVRKQAETIKLDEPFFSADGANSKRFTNVLLPMATLKSMVSDVEDLVGRELAPGGALSLAMDYSDLLLNHADAVDQAGFVIAAHLTDLTALGLGARGDLAFQAQRGGLRAVRLKAVLMILATRFAEPDFSAQRLAAAAGLSERYVNDLSYFNRCFRRRFGLTPTAARGRG